MATLGELVVSLSANTAQFTGAMDKAAYLSKQRMDGMQRAATQIGIGIASAVAASIVAFSAYAKSTVDAADNLNDLSQKIGISIRDLATWQLAAETSGTSLESVARGVKGLSAYMVENGEKLRAAGVTATDANGAMMQLADLFKGMPDGVEKTTIAVKLFGKAGMDMIPLLNLGSAGLKEMAEKSEEYGKKMAELAPHADKFNDQLGELALYSKAAGINITQYVVEGLNKTIENFITARKAGLGFFESLTGFGVRGLNESVDDAINNASTRINSLMKERDRIVGVLASDEDLGGTRESLESRLKDISGQLAYYRALQLKTLPKASYSNEGHGQDTTKQGNLMAVLQGEAKKAEKAIADVEKAAKHLHDFDPEGDLQFLLDEAALKRARDRFNEAEQAAEDFQKRIESMYASTSAGKYDQFVKDLEDAQKAFNMPGSTLTQDMLDAINSSLFGAGDKLVKEVSGVELAITNSFGRMGDAVADFAMGGKASFGDVINAMIRDLIRLQTQTLMTDLWKSVGGLSGISNILFSSSSAGVDGARASGGPVSAGGTYLVGENGPELLTMGGSSGHVTANGQSGGLQSVRVEIVNQGAQQMRVESAAPRFDARGMVVSIILGDMSGNGPITQGMASRFGLRGAVA